MELAELPLLCATSSVQALSMTTLLAKSGSQGRGLADLNMTTSLQRQYVDVGVVFELRTEARSCRLMEGTKQKAYQAERHAPQLLTIQIKN